MQIIDITDKLDLDYDVVLAPVIQSYPLFQQYIPVSEYYQNVQKRRCKNCLIPCIEGGSGI